ncbi:MAG: transglutaminaseTgpA domain-containing protein [Thermoanaerobaculia bacterium]
MTYGREKRILLGVAAFVVALPLPFNEMLEWPVLALYLVGVGAFLRRAVTGSERWLSNRTLNVLGLLYLPVLVFDVGASGRVQILRPVIHLILFGLAARLWSLSEEKHKWQVWIGIFFLFLASMATSVHPSVVLYLAFFLALTVVLMLRFVYLHALTAFGHRAEPAPRLPARPFAVATVVATLVLAVPLFALLPRVRSPYILGPGGSGQGELARAGFSDDMSLDLIGRIRDNRQVAMRLTFTGESGPPGAMRFKAATYDVWEGRTWRRSPRARILTRDPREGVFRLAPGRGSGSATVYLEPLRSTSLIVPMETLSVETQLAAIDIDRGGALSLRGVPTEIFEYHLTLGRREQSVAPLPGGASAVVADAAAEGGEDLALDLAGVTPRIARLAAEWAESGTAMERARRIERHLITEFGYSLEFIGRGGEQPIENFLFEARRGHCEYFASAMVLLLRAQGIPARLVTGFLGAEYSAWERSWLVRQSNAHAWVEGFVGDDGWVAFDPTPPAGRPLIEPGGLLNGMRQAYEFLTFRWDRYVISFDFYDQVGLIFNLRSLWERLSQELFAATSRSPTVAAAPEGGAAAVEPRPAPANPAGYLRWIFALAALLGIGGAILYWRQRPEWSVARAYVALVSTLRAGGLAIPPWFGPLAVDDLVSRRIPAVAPAAGRIVRSYLRESFAGDAVDLAQVAASRRDLAEVERVLSDPARRRASAHRGGGGSGPQRGAVGYSPRSGTGGKRE